MESCWCPKARSRRIPAPTSSAAWGSGASSRGRFREPDPAQRGWASGGLVRMCAWVLGSPRALPAHVQFGPAGRNRYAKLAAGQNLPAAATLALGRRVKRPVAWLEPEDRLEVVGRSRPSRNRFGRLASLPRSHLHRPSAPRRPKSDAVIISSSSRIDFSIDSSSACVLRRSSTSGIDVICLL